MLSNQLNLLTVLETAAVIGITEGRVRQLLKSGDIVGKKFGSQWAISETEALRYAALEAPAVGRPRCSNSKNVS